MDKNIVVVDIDGTISDCRNRLHYLEGKTKDWKAFYSEIIEDLPIEPIIHLVELLVITGHRVVFCTGRPRETCVDTLSWLDANLPIFNAAKNKATLFMREDDDPRPDHRVKPEILKSAKLPPEKVLFIIEDRDQMVKKWRDLGYTVLQPCEGGY